MKLRDELQSLDIFISSIQNKIIRARVKQVLNWNVKKATYHKYLFYSLSMINIILNSSIPIINQLDEYDLAITIIASITSIITSTITLINFKDVWYRYRKTAEEIKRECMKLNCRYGEYEFEDRETRFLINFESIVSNETDLWIESRFNIQENV